MAAKKKDNSPNIFDKNEKRLYLLDAMALISLGGRV